MDILTTAVYFGIAATIIMFLFNIFYSLLAGIFDVRIEGFGILATFYERYFLKFKRNEAIYTLGWIPTTSYVKIAGMFEEHLDTESAPVNDDRLLSSKTPIARFICTVGAPILLLIPFVIGATFIAPNGSLNDGFQVLNDVIYNIYQYIVGTIDGSQTTANWNAIKAAHHEFPIILCLMSLFTAFTSVASILSNTISQSIKMLMFVYPIILFIFYGYICYKIMALYFSIYGFVDGIIGILKFTVTIYLISFVLLMIIKYLPKNKYI